MIINNIKKHVFGNTIMIECQLKLDRSNVVQTVWYKFNRNEIKNIDKNGSFAIPAFILPAMRLGEDLHIDDKVSKKLFINTTKIADLILSWNMGFKRIKITHNGFVDSKKMGDKSASFFSLGVDSFYTYLKHKFLKSKITNLIFTHGFDIDLSNHNLYNLALKQVRKISKLERINTISVKTNIRNVTDNIVEWDWEHGGAMASIALLLNEKVGNVYFAGSDSWTQRKKLMPYGTHPNLDGLWSTESLKVIHDGNESTRFQKIQKYISKSELALNNLRVCNQNLKGKYNCSNCEKCIRTMIDLQINEALPKAKTFNKIIPLGKLANIHNEDFDTKIYFEDSLAELKKRNKYFDLQKAIEKSLFKSNHPTIIIKVFKSFANIDKKYNKRRLFNYIFKLKSDGDRKYIFKILSQLSIIR